ncbi:Ig-like domain-containing protein [Xylanimonas cellulosilytica]|uniref:Ig-like domain-containing protein n=1 Tax=Xylanimonas cellulosilytica TaxID=186189 RepID=UPI003CCAD3C4
MGLLSRLRANHRKAVSTGTVFALAAGLVTAAVLTDGEASADLQLNDAGVWVTNQSSGLVGRFNTSAGTLDGTLLAGSAAFDVDQQARYVLVADDGSSTASAVDVARLEFSSTTKVPAGARLAMGGGVVAVVDDESGSLWVTTLDGLPGLDPAKTDPTAELDGAAEVVVSETGVVHAVVPDRDVLWTVKPGADPETKTLDLMQRGDDVVLTTVGDDAVVLDRTRGRLRLPGGDTVEVVNAQGAQLQQPGPEADTVVYATSSALVEQPLRGGDATLRQASGMPAAPVRVAGCLYGAWSGTGQILRDCEGTDRDVDDALEDLDQTAVLRYRVNRDAVVLNDLAAGTVWIAMDQFERVDDWETTQPDEGEQDGTSPDKTTPEMVDSTVVDREKQTPPTAQDDEFGVRPGRATVLDVLSNDMDRDGDVITATRTGDQPAPITIEEVLDGAALQAVVPEDATGTVQFPYTVSDGRGGTDDAQVSLRVVPWGENADPFQLGEPVLRVQKGGRGAIRVLPYFRDPDGDDIYLATASVSVDGDEARAYPDGLVEFRDGGSATGRKNVTVTVGDGHGGVVEGTLWVDVINSQEPPVAVGDHVAVLAGQPVTVEPLANDSDPNGDSIRLVSVSEAAPAQITPNYDAGTFSFLARDPGSYDVLYQVSDGPSTTTGVVRVDVRAPDAASGAPVVVSDTVMLSAGGTALVDVLANDTDPAGGVLVVQSFEVPDDAGLSVTVLAHQVLRISESRRLAESVVIRYTVSNGTQVATGEVRVLPVPAPDRLQPPNAEPDEVTVRVGDYVTIDALANDTHPDGLELTIADDLEQGVDPEQGEIFVSEGMLRFRAEAQEGTAYAIYKVRDPNGQEDSAQVTIHIRGGDDNQAPTPPDVAARVITGGVVRVRIPLDGIDPDGDSVQLVNIVAPPALGIAEIVDGRFIDFQATRGAIGQDTLTYSVVDARGAKAQGVVRIGIAPPATTNHAPIAEDDVVWARPGRTVSAAPLGNDSDPDGDQYGLVGGGIEAADPLDPKVEGERIVVRTPEEEGAYGFYYTIEDTWGARAMGAVTLEVSLDAPLQAPIARDDIVLDSAITFDQTSVTVPLLDNDEDPDGAASELEVAVDADTATVTTTSDDETVVEVRLTAQRQVITYTVTDQDGLQGKAFLLVPAGKTPELADELREEDEELTEDQAELTGPAPMLKANFSPLEVKSGEPLTVDVADAVVVAEGGAARIADPATAKAVAGSVVVQDERRLVYTSAEDYVGPAAVSVLVTDGLGSSPQDADHTLVIQVPITVLPPDNLPPEPGQPSGQVAAGEESTVDLGRFATDPNDDALTFALGTLPDGLSATLTGSVVTLEAAPDLVKGVGLTVPFTVSDGANPSVDGELAVTVVASIRPLAKANPDSVEGAHQGVPVSVPVLANDMDPFDPKGLELISAVVQTGQGSTELDGDEVIITPAPTFVGTLVASYRIQDATKDPDRLVEGTVTVTVLGVPEAPAAASIEEVRSKTVVLSWTPPQNNGAPITGYTVTSSQGDVFDCATTTCTLDGLTNNVTYTFTVVATNEVGPSDPSPASAPARPDEKPDPPAAPKLAFGDGSLTVTWTNATYTDRSPISEVNLQISPAPPSGALQKKGLTGETTVWEGLENGVAYKVQVQAVNAAPDPSEWGEWSTEMVPAGKPDAPGAPTASRTASGAVNVKWNAPASNGDAISNYYVDVYRDGSLVQENVDLKTATSHDFTGLTTTASYTFAVSAKNKAGEGATSSRSNAAIPYGAPKAPTNVKATDNKGVPTVTWSAADGNGSPVIDYTVTASGGKTMTTTGTSVNFTGLTAGTTYTFTVTARNLGGTSSASAASGGVKAYGLPSAPSVTWTKTTATDGYFTVNAPSSWNGDTGTVSWSLSGSETKSGTGTGRIDITGGHSKSYKVTTSATNGAGTTTGGTATGTTDAPPPPPNPQVRVTNSGRPGTYNNDCVSACQTFLLQANADFPSGKHTFVCYNSSGGDHAFGTAMETTLNANGTVELNCYLGYTGGADVWVSVDGHLNYSVRTTWFR